MTALIAAPAQGLLALDGGVILGLITVEVLGVGRALGADAAGAHREGFG